MKRILIALVMTVSCGISFAYDNMAKKPAAAMSKKNIVETAVEAGNFTTLATALQAAGLVDTLKGKGPFTVFAPTDAAFAKLPAGTLEKLLTPEKKAVLAQILKYHVVGSRVMAKDVTSGKVMTVEGTEIMVSTDGGVKLNGTSTVTKTDISASNGVIHVIDTVILPKGLKL